VNRKYIKIGRLEEQEMDMELDTKGMNCPLPVLKAKKALSQLEAGNILKILATDPGSVEDFGAFCRSGGHELIESSEAEGVFTYILKKGG
jgi:tRNA 2-thiouridine synthesizing protein A